PERRQVITSADAWLERRWSSSSAREARRRCMRRSRRRANPLVFGKSSSGQGFRSKGSCATVQQEIGYWSSRLQTQHQWPVLWTSSSQKGLDRGRNEAFARTQVHSPNGGDHVKRRNYPRLEGSGVQVDRRYYA